MKKLLTTLGLVLGVSIASQAQLSSVLHGQPATSSYAGGEVTAANLLYIAEGIVTRSSDQGVVRVRDINTGRVIREIAGAGLTDKFGKALALRGTELIVGMPGLNAGSGGFAVYDIPSGRRLALFIAPSTGSNCGFSIATDGNLVVVGCPFDPGPIPGGFDQGSVMVFDVAPGKWLPTPVPTLTVGAPDSESDAFFGQSVAIHGKRIAVGAPLHDAAFLDGGKAYVFNENGALLTSFVASAANESFGFTVALTPSHLVVGAPDANAGQGLVRFCNLRNLATTQISGPLAGSNFGESIAANDRWVIVGAPKFDTPGATDAGMALVYSEPTEETPIALLEESYTPPYVVANGKLGHSVALVGDRMVLGMFGPGSFVGDAGTWVVDGLSRLQGFGPAPVEGAYHQGDSVTQVFSEARVMRSFTQVVATDSTTQLALAARALAVKVGTNTAAGSAVVQTLNGGRRCNVAQRTAGLNTTDVFDPIGNSDRHVISSWKGTYLGPPTSPTGGIWSLAVGSNLGSYLELGQEAAGVKFKTFYPARHGNATVALDFLAVPTVYSTATASPAVTAINDTGISFFNAATLIQSAMFREGSPSVHGPNYGQFATRCSFEERNVVFTAALQGALAAEDTCLVSNDSTNGAQIPAARENQAAPGTGGAGFSAFLGEMSNARSGNQGYLFRATLRARAGQPAPVPAVTTANNEALFTNANFGNQALALRKGDTVTGLPATVKIGRFISYWITVNHYIVAHVSLTGTGVTAANDGALILHDPLTPVNRVLMREGSPLAGAGSAVVGVIQAVDGKPGGDDMAALVTLVQKAGEVNATNDQALVSLTVVGGTNDFAQRITLRKGARLLRGTSEIIKSIALPGRITDGASGALGTGMGHVVNKTGKIGALLTLTDGLQSASLVNP
jgi:hypothetical protein